MGKFRLLGNVLQRDVRLGSPKCSNLNVESVSFAALVHARAFVSVKTPLSAQRGYFYGRHYSKHCWSVDSMSFLY